MGEGLYVDYSPPVSLEETGESLYTEQALQTGLLASPSHAPRVS